MKRSKMIALSALTTAFCVIVIVVGAYFELFDLSCLFISSVILMIPLSKKCYLGAFLSYLATVILSFILTGARFQIIIPFAVFFGLHPIVNALQFKFNVNRYLALIVKTVWFILTLFITYYFTKMFLVENELILKYINYVLVIGGALFFIIYDRVMIKFQTLTEAIINRLKL